jgi:plastocyanin
MTQLLFRTAAAFFSGAVFLAAAQAGTVQVSVTDLDGKPVADVVVLVSGNGNGKAPGAGASGPVVIAQQDLRFVPALSVMPVGTSVRFVNRDGFDHHVRSTPSGPLGNTPAVTSFEFRLDALAGIAASAARKRSEPAAADIKLETAGPIGLGCHLHSSMRGQIYVSPTPWFGKTDASGVATIEGVPDGAADLAIWHGEQLQAQPVQRLQVGAATAKATAQLNFTPRRRRS